LVCFLGSARLISQSQRHWTRPNGCQLLSPLGQLTWQQVSISRPAATSAAAAAATRATATIATAGDQLGD